MAITSDHGKQRVASTPLPAPGIGLNKANPAVASGKGKIKRASAGKNASAGSISTGVFHGNHAVAHPIKGKSLATPSLKTGSSQKSMGQGLGC